RDGGRLLRLRLREDQLLLVRLHLQRRELCRRERDRLGRLGRLRLVRLRLRLLGEPGRRGRESRDEDGGDVGGAAHQYGPGSTEPSAARCALTSALWRDASNTFVVIVAPETLWI